MINPWQKAKIVKTEQATADMKSVIVEPEKFLEFKPGQHCEICLPGENVIRKYSIVSGLPALAGINEKKFLEFGIQLISNGALSPKLWELKVGDEMEIRGPIGSSFVWESTNTAPLILIGAGSGITPLLSIYDSYKWKHPRDHKRECVFIMSAKDSGRIMHYEKLKDILITRFTAKEGRIDLEFLKKNIGNLANNPDTACYVSGPDNFVDDMVDYVLELGFKEDNIRSERFI